MTCTPIKLPGGGMAIVCTRGRRTPARCDACKARPHEVLCDFELYGAKAGKTCDRKLCRSCAVKDGPGRDFCYQHAVEIKRRRRDARDWLDAVKLFEDYDGATVYTTPMDKDVDLKALDGMFPRWSEERLVAAENVDPVDDAQRGRVSLRNGQSIGANKVSGGEISPDGHTRTVRREVSIGEKVRYVKTQGQTRNHGCHWPGCEAQVPPAKWGCTAHWFKLPKYLRDRIWATYRVGQERTMTPSREYVAAARDVEAWIREYVARQTPEADKTNGPDLWSKAVDRARGRT